MARKPLIHTVHVPAEIAKTLAQGEGFDATFEDAHYAKAARVVSAQYDDQDHARVTFEITGKLGAALQKRFSNGNVSGVSIGPLN